MNRILNVGVIGVGAIGKHHLQSYMSNPKARVVAVADIDEGLAKTVATQRRGQVLQGLPRPVGSSRS